MERNILSTIIRVQVAKAFMKSSYLKALIVDAEKKGTWNKKFSFQIDEFGILYFEFSISSGFQSPSAKTKSRLVARLKLG